MMTTEICMALTIALRSQRRSRRRLRSKLLARSPQRKPAKCAEGTRNCLTVLRYRDARRVTVEERRFSAASDVRHFAGFSPGGSPPCFTDQEYGHDQQLRLNRVAVASMRKDKIVDRGISEDQSREKPGCRPLLALRAA